MRFLSLSQKFNEKIVACGLFKINLAEPQEVFVGGQGFPRTQGGYAETQVQTSRLILTGKSNLGA